MEVDTDTTEAQQVLDNARAWIETSEANYEEALQGLNEASVKVNEGTRKYHARIEKELNIAIKQKREYAFTNNEQKKEEKDRPNIPPHFQDDQNMPLTKAFLPAPYNNQYKSIHATLTKPYHQQETDVSFQHTASTQAITRAPSLVSSMQRNLGGLSLVYRVLYAVVKNPVNPRPAIFPAKLHLLTELELDQQDAMQIGGPAPEHIWISTELYPILRPVSELSADPSVVLKAERRNPNTIIHPWGLTVHPSKGELYVTEHNRSIITSWFCGQDLSMKRDFCLGGENPTIPVSATAETLQRPRGIAISLQGRIAVAETDAHRIQIYTYDWKPYKTISSVTAEPSRLSSPYHVVFDPEDNLYVADTCNNRVLKFDSKGEFLFAIQRNTAANQAQGHYRGNDFFQSYVNGIAVDKEGLLFVLAAGANQVRVFNSDGTHRRDIPLGYSIGNQGWGALARGPDGTLVVSDYNNNRVTILGYDGKQLRQLKVDRPTCAVYDLEGRLFVVSHDRSSLLCF